MAKNCDPRQICLDYRLDIFFRVFVLTTQNRSAWEEFCSVPANLKIAKKQHTVRGLFRMAKDIRSKGQKIPVPVMLCDEKLYPLDGATRITTALSSGLLLKIIVKDPRDKQLNPNYEPGGNPLSRSWMKGDEEFLISDELLRQFFLWKQRWKKLKNDAK